jgi:D-alanyl-lipoteichoic acid acyltransferase DltB (MBOAT superfamily)
MLFSSLQYFVFLPFVLLIYYLLPQSARWVFILLSSVFFLLCAGLSNLYVVFAVIIINYFSGLLLDSLKKRSLKKIVFITTITLDIGILAFFKYFNFLNDNFTIILNLVGLQNPIPALSLLLPLGISFYTFQAIGYTYDVYNGNQKAERNAGLFSAYLLFFPKFIAGPVERAYQFLPQLQQSIHFDYNRIVHGFRLILWGLFKKMVIGDRLAIFVNYGFNNVRDLDGLSLFILIFFQAFQLYADFSGYTDIAIGSAKVLGFNLSDNFNKPFISKTVSEYWRRWHISLASWVNDYIYKPLSLSIAIRRNWGRWGIIYSLTVTFVLFGLWHGASWSFVVFGLSQSVALAYEILSRKMRRKLSNTIPNVIYNPFSILITFLFICYSAVFFRANDLKDAFYVIFNSFNHFSDIFNPAAIRLHLNNLGLNKWDVWIAGSGILVIVGTHISKFYGINEALENRSVYLRWFVYVFLILGVIFLGTFMSQDFMYFQF